VPIVYAHFTYIFRSDEIIQHATRSGKLADDALDEMQTLMDRLPGDRRLEVVRELSVEVNRGNIRISNFHRLPL
jgi:hypothetical protein